MEDIFLGINMNYLCVPKLGTDANYSLDVLLFLFGTSLLFHGQF